MHKNTSFNGRVLSGLFAVLVVAWLTSLLIPGDAYLYLVTKYISPKGQLTAEGVSNLQRMIAAVRWASFLAAVGALLAAVLVTVAEKRVGRAGRDGADGSAEQVVEPSRQRVTWPEVALVVVFRAMIESCG
jgi:hypothetical protein